VIKKISLNLCRFLLSIRGSGIEEKCSMIEALAGRFINK